MSHLPLLAIFLIPAIILALATLLTWVERRLLGLWQDRHGPNRVGPGGLFQAVADGIKILFKQDWIPPFADKTVFVLAPSIGMMTVLLSFAAIPFTPVSGIAGNLNIGLLFILGMMGLGVYAVVLAGWASNSKYALLGGMRAAAQMISYEVFMGLSLLGVVMIAGSFNLHDIVTAQTHCWFILPQCLGFFIFLLAGIAETHRLPFDLPEGENELGAGFHTEYSGMKFGMFFIAEYAGIILISSLVTTLYLGGWLGPVLPAVVWFVLKTSAVVIFFILLRAALPRPRYDQLMALGWKILLPLSLLNVTATGTVLMLRAAG
ncbi:NADH-quinone oxidoreductase subunit NuoH [Acetobacter tropicalis]|uniref:NADH-quinone oxidoreductase subunit H n=1 Tax=Acetobacter tropicalis TaxID=104102 RepID=A0A094YK70_9PROT|nr:NADH-quinone oxidoreductase subunit NuoH [Acetobacter tropicalis]KAA8383569.1 NADH-quinone oxidoreductase subunit NuoH [Acetobacter tropicalis]KAA8389352.1 NADH-quinone oxidoreductase subunit NuoH [Acetobacter tropicalis]KGB21044.1 NADH-ubiquinone oxidoreductase chain H [Acetobacter tropicalis]MBC9008689.1 NADH-quinone oxidoreductase subunit NuoH [Acetobacter tropicalis]MDO8173026.1 NADH-quinone oxidoreductase subunit NuoH [Acetobacter tropicalis]